MLVSYRPTLVRQPLRVGWFRYSRLWLGYHAAHAKVWARPVVVPVVAAAERLRPRPFSDARLLVAAVAIGLFALAVGGVLAFALAEWFMTSMDDELLASGGAVAVGAAFLALTYLVFASKRERRRPSEVDE